MDISFLELSRWHDKQEVLPITSMCLRVLHRLPLCFPLYAILFFLKCICGNVTAFTCGMVTMPLDLSLFLSLSSFIVSLLTLLFFFLWSNVSSHIDLCAIMICYDINIIKAARARALTLTYTRSNTHFHVYMHVQHIQLGNKGDLLMFIFMQVGM